MACSRDALEDQQVVAVRVGGDEGQLEMGRHGEAAECDVSGAIEVRVRVLVALELQLSIHAAGVVDHDPAPDAADAKGIGRTRDTGDRVLAVQRKADLIGGSVAVGGRWARACREQAPHPEDDADHELESLHIHTSGWKDALTNMQSRLSSVVPNRNGAYIKVLVRLAGVLKACWHPLAPRRARAYPHRAPTLCAGFPPPRRSGRACWSARRRHSCERGRTPRRHRRPGIAEPRLLPTASEWPMSRRLHVWTRSGAPRGSSSRRPPPARAGTSRRHRSPAERGSASGGRPPRGPRPDRRC